MAVRCLRNVESVPVDDRGFIELVLEADPHALPAPETDGRAQIRPFDVLQGGRITAKEPPRITPHARGCSGQQVRLVGCSGEAEFHIRRRSRTGLGEEPFERRQAGGLSEADDGRRTEELKGVRRCMIRIMCRAVVLAAKSRSPESLDSHDIGDDERAGYSLIDSEGLSGRQDARPAARRCPQN